MEKIAIKASADCIGRGGEERGGGWWGGGGGGNYDQDMTAA